MSASAAPAWIAPQSTESDRTPGPRPEYPQPALSRQAGNGGNQESPPKRRKPPKDNLEYLQFARRMLRAYGRRVMAEDPSTLAELMTLRAEVDAVVERAARSLHEQGWSWGEIGQEVGLTRHTARKRWGTDGE